MYFRLVLLRVGRAGKSRFSQKMQKNKDAKSAEYHATKVLL